MQIAERLKLIIKKRALHQTGYVAVGSLINGLSLFALNIVLARALNQELFGIFSLSVLALMTVAELSDFGLNLGLLRFAPYYLATDQPDKLKQLIKTIWRWRISLTGTFTFGGIVFAYPLAKYLFNQTELAPYFAFTSLGIGGVILLGFLATYLQAKQKFFYNAFVQSLKGFLRLLLVLIFMVLGVKNLFVYLSAYIFVPWILFFANYRVFPEKFRKVEIPEGVKQKLHSQLARFSFWLTISSLVSIFSSRIDQIMISRLLGLKEVAIFTVAWQLIQFFPVIYGSITSVLMPKISSLKTKPELITFIKRIFKWVLVGTIGIAILVYPSQYLINFLFGQKYVEAMPIYLILAYGYLLNVLVIPFSLIISVFNKTELTTISSILQLVINLVGNIVFIPLYGIMGAAYTFAFSVIILVVWNVVSALYLLKKVELVIEK